MSTGTLEALAGAQPQAARALEWASDKPELHAWARRYFEERREDEDEPAA